MALRGVDLRGGSDYRMAFVDIPSNGSTPIGNTTIVPATYRFIEQ